MNQIDEATMTVVLIDAAGDETPDGDFVYVEGVTIDDIRSPERWERLRTRLAETAEEIEQRDRPDTLARPDAEGGQP